MHSFEVEHVDQDKLVHYVHMLGEGAPDQRLNAASCIKRLLGILNAELLDKIVELNVVPVLVGFLSLDDQTMLQYEAVGALTNLACSAYTQKITSDAEPHGANAIPQLVRLVASSHALVQDQACTCLGNIASHNAELRNRILAVPNSLTTVLAAVLKPCESLKRTAAWCVLSGFLLHVFLWCWLLF